MDLKHAARLAMYGSLSGAVVGLVLIIAGGTSVHPGDCVAQFVAIVACGAGVGLGVAYGPKQVLATAQRARRWFIGNQPSVPLGRWQFTIARLLAAMAGLAFVFGFLAHTDLLNSTTIGFAAMVVVTSVFIPHIGRMAVGVPVIVASFILGLGLGQLLVGKSSRYGGPGLALVACAVVVGCVVLLRLYGRYSAWHLLGSLLLLQVVFFLAVIPDGGWVHVSNALGWNACITIPWLVAIVLGEAIGRRWHR